MVSTWDQFSHVYLFFYWFIKKVIYTLIMLQCCCYFIRRGTFILFTFKKVLRELDCLCLMWVLRQSFNLNLHGHFWIVKILSLFLGKPNLTCSKSAQYGIFYYFNMVKWEEIIGNHTYYSIMSPAIFYIYKISAPVVHWLYESLICNF